MRIACISDIHGNLYAFIKALKILEGLDIDEIVFMGDAVGYIPGPQVLRHLKELNCHCIMGNHEDMLLNGAYTDEKDKFYQMSETLKRSSQRDMDYIRSWPTQKQINDIAFFHASPNDHLYEYIYPDTDLNGYCLLLKNKRYCVVGHTHRPFIRKHNDIKFINTGSIGLPRDDGRYGAFAIIDTSSNIEKIFRFEITSETKRSIEEFGPVHSSVHNLMNRRAKEQMVGEIIHACS
tara:strand:+ start:42068 stop:42772 length:705 start_codon:yes stop_codon:yes gene_type:complete